MKLIERELGIEVELKENIVSVLVLEQVDKRLYIIDKLYSQVNGKDGDWILVENEKKYDLSKRVDIILEPFSLEINSKKIKAKLYQDLKCVAQDYCFVQGNEIHSNICNYLEKIIERIPYPVKYNEEWDVLEIFKIYGVEFEEECDDLCEKLFNYIKLVNQVCGINIFIVLNIKKYLTKDQLVELHKITMYNKIHLILVEFDDCNEKYECEEKIIIDKDGCIITY